MKTKGLPSYNFKGKTKRQILQELNMEFGALMPVKKINDNFIEFLSLKTSKTLVMNNTGHSTHVYIKGEN